MSEPFRTGGGPTGMRALLGRVLSDKTGDDALRRLELERIWVDLVGPAVAQHTRPAFVSGDKLVIESSSPVWNQTLQGLERRLLKRLAEQRPDLRIGSLRCQVGAPQAPAAKPPAAGEATAAEIDAVVLPASVERQVASATGRIEDPELRQRVAAAMRRQQQLTHWRLARGWTIDPVTGDLRPPAEAPPRRRPTRYDQLLDDDF